MSFFDTEKNNAENNDLIGRVTALEAKLFELIKQESPDNYGAFVVNRAIKLLIRRLFG